MSSSASPSRHGMGEVQEIAGSAATAAGAGEQGPDTPQACTCSVRVPEDGTGPWVGGSVCLEGDPGITRAETKIAGTPITSYFISIRLITRYPWLIAVSAFPRVQRALTGRSLYELGGRGDVPGPARATARQASRRDRS